MPDQVSIGDMTAWYDQREDIWEFEWDGVEFRISGRPLNPVAFDWAREVGVTVTDGKIVDVLGGD